MLSEAQQMLAESAAEVLAASAGPERLRELRSAGVSVDAPLWAQLVELGWPAIPAPEEQGGLGWGLAEQAVVFEALGRFLAPTPLLSTVLFPGTALDGQVTALAWQERSGDGGLEFSSCGAACAGGTLTGDKVEVHDGAAAGRFVVLARSGSELGLFEVHAADAQVQPGRRMDGRDVASVSFDSAPASPCALSLDQLGSALDRAAIALAAEALGGAQAVFDITIAFLKERVQFEQPIGAFQALQHRAVDCFVAIELARATVLAAAADPSPQLASLAKARAGAAYRHVAKEAVQLHGGIGMTDECDVGFYLKRALGLSHTLGSARYHRDRWARLRGY